MYDYRKYHVLYVDDEEQSLKYFRKAFQEDFSILTSPNVREAEEILERQSGQIGILITDQRMPGRTGVDLLGRVRRSQPRIVRMLTTAYSDLDSAIGAVNSGAIFKYIVKPWNLQDLRGCLLRGMEFFLVQLERDTPTQGKNEYSPAPYRYGPGSQPSDHGGRIVASNQESLDSTEDFS